MASASVSGSSRGSSPAGSDGEDDGPDPAQLAALEKLLQASLGYALVPQDPAPSLIVEEPVQVVGEPAASDDKVGPVSDEPESDQDEVVPFRLFSTQRVPQAIVIRESDFWRKVADPRIRDVEDELAEVVEERTRRIASVAVDGDSIIAQAALLVASSYASTSTHILTTLLDCSSFRPPVPTLVSLSIYVPEEPLIITKITLSRSARRKLRRVPRQYPRHAVARFPQTVLLHRHIKEEVPLTLTEQAQKTKREKKEAVLSTQREMDARGQRKREEKEQRRIAQEEEREEAKKGKPKSKKRKIEVVVSVGEDGEVVETTGGARKSALAKARRAAKRKEARELEAV